MDSEIDVFRQKLNDLIDDARISGVPLNAKVIRERFQDMDVTDAQYMAITDYIIRAGIEYDDSYDTPAQSSQPQETEDLFDLTLPDDISSDDPVHEYIRELSEKEPLAEEEQERLVNKYLGGDEDAQQILIEYNLRRVIPIAREYHGRGVPFDDLVQEGSTGLIEGVSEFRDYGRKYHMTFAEFITGYVRSAIMKAITEQARDIGIGDQVADTLNEAKRVSDEFEEEYGREATREEIVEELGISPERLADMAELVKDPSEVKNLTGKGGNGGEDGQKGTD